MSSTETSPVNGDRMPDRSIIGEIMNDCHLGEEQAVALLRRSNNDPARAKHHHRLRKRYISSAALRSSQPPTPSEANFPESPNGMTGDANGRPAHDRRIEKLRPYNQPLQEPGVHTPGSFAGPENGYIIVPPRTPDTEPPTSSHQTPEIDTSSLAEINQSRINENKIDPGNAPSEKLGFDSDRRQDDLADSVPATEAAEADAWDFVLPSIPSLTALLPKTDDGHDEFSMHDLVGALQNNASLQTMQHYLGYLDESTVRKGINETVEGFPAMFYVIERNDESILRAWVAYGGDVASVHEPSKIPLLAFAIMHSETIQADTTLMTATLLSLGAIPRSIPSAFYTPYLRDVPESLRNGTSSNGVIEEGQEWCINSARARLARTATLSQRYYLERAANIKKPSLRHRQVARLRNAEPLLGIPYFLIGQTIAANLLLQKLLSYLVVPSKRPLVLVFAGPSGHGKTELARRLGLLLSLELEVVDCTIFNREMELFGPRHPYVGADKGSPLNNFLARNTGQRCIVFLDEFEKTTNDIHKALLLPFDKGEYQDRRHLTTVDCSKTIWILATNAHDEVIQQFYSTYGQELVGDSDESHKMRLMKQLCREIKDDFLTKFYSPITGRISAFLPFLPFSPGEQAVVVHKYLLELGRRVRRNISLEAGPKEQLLGNVKLRIRRDAAVCRILAESEYHFDLGARSLISAVDSIENMLVEAYLEMDEEIAETDGLNEFVVDVKGREVVVTSVPTVS